MIKQTPKSCSCSACRRGKHGGGRDIMRYDERAYRHQAKIDLNKGIPVYQAAPIGNYYD